MPKYMLTRGQKRQPLVGHREIDRNGTKIIQKITHIFEPQKIVETEDDVTMQHWVDDKILVEIPDSVVPKKVAPPKKEGNKKEEPKAPEKEPEREPKAPSDDDEVDDYEEKKDGTFQCLHCEKKLKTEVAMIRHIESKH